MELSIKQRQAAKKEKDCTAHPPVFVHLSAATTILTGSRSEEARQRRKQRGNGSEMKGVVAKKERKRENSEIEVSLTGRGSGLFGPPSAEDRCPPNHCF